MTRLAVAVTLAVVAAGLVFDSGDLDFVRLFELVRLYGPVVSLVFLVFGLYEHLLWHLPVVQRTGRLPRDIRGTWKGELESFWIDETTGTRPAVKTVYLVVHQTASTVRASLLTDESSSVSRMGRVERGDESCLVYSYTNEPDQRYREGSPIHHGSASLRIVGNPPGRLAGSYWTSRQTIGELRFDRRVGVFAEGFEEAQEAFRED